MFSCLFNEACRNLGTLIQLQISPSKPGRPHNLWQLPHMNNGAKPGFPLYYSPFFVKPYKTKAAKEVLPVFFPQAPLHRAAIFFKPDILPFVVKLFPPPYADFDLDLSAAEIHP